MHYFKNYFLNIIYFKVAKRIYILAKRFISLKFSS